MAFAGRRFVLSGLVALLVLSVSAAGLVWFVLNNERGNRWLCDLVARQIGSGLRGRLEVDRIDALHMGGMTAHGVRFLAPDGVAAIDAPHVVLEFSAWELLRGRYGWSRAEIDKPIVRVLEYKNGKTNMEELFASPTKGASSESQGSEDGPPIDMRNMITNDAKLFIGGALPQLYLSNLHGAMRIEIAPSGDTVLRFDNYRGKIDGLPVGALAFHDVVGHVWTSGQHLLHFAGAGRTKGEPLDFELDIAGKPVAVQIEARFDDPASVPMATRTFAAWSKLLPNLTVDVGSKR